MYIPAANSSLCMLKHMLSCSGYELVLSLSLSNELELAL